MALRGTLSEVIQLRINADTDDAQDAIDGLVDTLASPAGLLGAATAAGTAVAAFALDTLAAADELDALSRISGLNVETLQRMGEIASRSGGSIEDVADAAREMQLRLAEAAALGSGPAVDALALLGLTLDEIPLDDASASLELLRARISAVEDPAQRLFIAEELLGGSVERLNGLLAAQESELEAVRVLTEEQIAAADELNDRWAELSHEMTTFAQGALINIIDTLGDMPRALRDIADDLTLNNSVTRAAAAETEVLTDRQKRHIEVMDELDRRWRLNAESGSRYLDYQTSTWETITTTSRVTLELSEILDAQTLSFGRNTEALNANAEALDAWQGRLVTVADEARRLLDVIEAQQRLRQYDISGLVGPEGTGFAGIGGLPTQGVADVAPPPLPDGAVL